MSHIQTTQTIRREHGMSLAAVLAMGTALTLFSSALLTGIMPVLQKTGSLKHGNTARTFAELGTDYAIQRLNTIYASSNNGNGNTNANGIDCTDTLGSSVSWQVPSDILNDPKAQVTVTVENIGNPPGNFNDQRDSILFDPLLNLQNPNFYRRLTVSANYGGAAGKTTQVRAILQPIMSAGSGIFPYGVFGVASVVYAGQAGYNTYNNPIMTNGVRDMRIGAEGGTLGKISQVYGGGGLSRSITQGGSHYEYPDPQSYYAQQYNWVGSLYTANPASTAPWNTMMGNSYSNGKNTAYYPVTGPGDSRTPRYTSGSSDNPVHNVFGIMNGIQANIPNGQQNGVVPVASPPAWTGGLTAWNVGPTNSNGVTYAQPPIAPAPSAPAGAISLGSVSLQNGAQLIFDANAPAPNGPIGTINGETVRIRPGAYSVNSLSVTGGSSIQIANGTQAQIATTLATKSSSASAVPPVQLYVGGTNNSSVLVNIDNTSSINTNGISGGSGFNTQGKNGIANALASNQIAINDPNPASGLPQITETSGSARQLQIFCSSNGINTTNAEGTPTTFNTQIILSGNERMTIYAPSTGILIGSPVVGSGGPSAIANDANYYGAVVGGSVGVNSAYGSGGGAFLHYDANLRTNADGTGGVQGTFINPWSQTPPYIGGGRIGYRAVTWQEI